MDEGVREEGFSSKSPVLEADGFSVSPDYAKQTCPQDTAGHSVHCFEF